MELEYCKSITCDSDLASVEEIVLSLLEGYTRHFLGTDSNVVENVEMKKETRVFPYLCKDARKGFTKIAWKTIYVLPAFQFSIFL